MKVTMLAAGSPLSARSAICHEPFLKTGGQHSLHMYLVGSGQRFRVYFQGPWRGGFSISNPACRCCMKTCRALSGKH